MEQTRASSTRALAANESLILEKEERALLSLVPGIFALADNAAEIQLEALHIIGNGNETSSAALHRRVARLRLVRGSLTVTLPSRHGTSESHVEIATPIVECRADMNALFRCEFDERRLRIVAVRGYVYLHRAGVMHLIRHGDFVDVTSPTSHLSSKSVTDDAAAIASTQRALQDEDELATAVSSRQDQLP